MAVCSFYKFDTIGISLTRARFNMNKRNLFVQLSEGDNTVFITLKEARRFIEQCAKALGVPQDNCVALADLLIEADKRGHYGHGLHRIDRYLNDIEKGLCDGKATPKILKETPATAWVDGQNGMGAVVAKFGIDLAIKKAKKEGVGWVSVKGSNHYGIGGIYTSRAIKQGVIGMCFSNTSPIMSPTRSKAPAVGSNPITVGAPAENKDTFHLDMATTAVALGKLEVARRKKIPIPEGWAQDKDGKSTTDAEVGYSSRCMMPLGGLEITSGYKGYGLAMMVETFCGMLSGSQYGHHIRMWGQDSRVADLGHCFVAVNPKCFASDFEKRLSDLLNYIRKMEPIDPKKPVLVPGDPERLHMQAAKKAGGVRYLKTILDTCQKLSDKLKVAPLKSAL